MKKALLLLLAITYTTSSSIFYAQCTKPEKMMKPSYKQGWGVDAQSRSGVLEMGKPYELSFVASKGVDYKVTTATSGDDENVQIDFVLYEMAVGKVEENGKSKYIKYKKVLFDSKDNDNARTIEFSSTKSRKVFINVTVPAGADDGGQMQCVGVLIEHQKSAKEGF